MRTDIARDKRPSPREKTAFVKRRTKLARALSKFRQLQSTYTPTAIQLINQVLSSDPPNPPNTILVENVKLYLPSELPESHRHGDQMVQLIDIEIKLREGQCHSSLDSLQCKLLVKSRMITYRVTNVWHQGSLTRSQRLLKRIESSIVLYTDKYRTAWDVLYRLNGSTTDGMTWKRLRKTDIRIMDEVRDAAIRSQWKKIGGKKQAAELAKETSEGRRTISWIWQGAEGDMEAGLYS